ncbi:hypothetical protein AX16_010956 [Volvariella volvacea WC 439]|nr:hypothetical protein AX16_010956 [Volvariella volvacea WC 439]
MSAQLGTRTQAITAAIADRLPYCVGTLPVFGNQNLVFFRQGDTANFVDLSQATPARLKDLSATCQTASSAADGRRTRTRNMHKVLEEKDFSFKFDPNSTLIVELIKTALLDGKDETKAIKAEICDLTLHDKDAYAGPMRSGTDSKNFIGTLRLCFPTRLTGGSIVVRHKKEEWTVKPAEVPAKLKWPVCVFIASLKGATHEVTTVEAGHLVTISYNLFFAEEQEHEVAASRETRKTQILPKPSLTSDITPSLHSLLTGLLQTPELLPHGGYLAFNLAHFYPSLNEGGKQALCASVLSQLKPRDLAILQACQSLELSTSLHLVVQDAEEGSWVLLDEKVEFVTLDVEAESWDESFGGSRIVEYMGEPSTIQGAEFVHWVVPFNENEQKYLGHCQFTDKEDLARLVHCFCLMARIGAVDKRETI